MERWKQSIAAKIIAWILVTASAFAVAAGVGAAYLIDRCGLYDDSGASARESLMETMSDRYSVYVLAHLDDTDAVNDYFSDKNFKYGVIEASSPAQLAVTDLNSDASYVARNFTDEVELSDLHLFSCNISDQTYFNVPEELNLLSQCYAGNVFAQTVERCVNAYIYDAQTGIFYYDTMDGLYYPVKKIAVAMRVPDDANGLFVVTDCQYDAETRTYQAISDEYKSEADLAAVEHLKQPEMLLYLDVVAERYTPACGVLAEASFTFRELFDAAVLDPSACMAQMRYPSANVSGMETADIRIITEDTAPDTSSVVNRTDYDDYTPGYLQTFEGGTQAVHYYVVSYVQEPLVKKDGATLWQNDLYVQADALIQFAEQMQYGVYAVIAVAMLLGVGSFVFLVAAAGHRRGTDGIAEGVSGKIPWEVFTCLIAAAEYLLLLVIRLALSGGTGIFQAVGAGFFALCGAWLLLWYILDFAVRIKRGTWWRRTLGFRLFSAAKSSAGQIAEHLSLLWKWVFFFLAANFIELILLRLFGELDSIPRTWLLEKAVIFFAVTWLLIQAEKLLDGGRRIAQGDVLYKIDIKGMPSVLREHGEDLNSIGDGVSAAVDEKMKSERFKTELITNVSHDIKTPLTSIINYVDLMEKDAVCNEQGKEYLEVLKRQSARLKKLIEDLIEASKASSGSLSVNKEKLEAGVFLVQTVGEFEEKTVQNGLDLIVKKPEEPIYIMADGRHFWRVIDNLMNNICKYAQPQTRVYINLEQADGKVKITFRNTSRYALNITAEELMERFVRGDSSRNTDGNGLGLSIAKSLMELMGGTLRLYVDGDLFKVVLEFECVEFRNC